MASSEHDTRTPEMKLADMELAEVRAELMRWGEELSNEGRSEREVVGAFCEELEERLARLYCQYFEILSELGVDQEVDAKEPHGPRDELELYRLSRLSKSPHIKAWALGQLRRRWRA